MKEGFIGAWESIRQAGTWAFSCMEHLLVFILAFFISVFTEYRELIQAVLVCSIIDWFLAVIYNFKKYRKLTPNFNLFRKVAHLYFFFTLSPCTISTIKDKNGTPARHSAVIFYSLLSASTGSFLEAIRAGITPAIIVSTTLRITSITAPLAGKDADTITDSK